MSRSRASSGSPYEDRYGFARAVRDGDRVLVSGTGPVWPDGSCDPDPAVQMARCLEIVRDALERVGSSLEDVVRTRMFISDRDHADAIGEIHGRAFAGVRPAATMVVTGLLDARWEVEIEVEALIGRRSERR